MAFVVKDRVKETTTTTGTSDLVLSGSVSGFQSFSNALADGDTTYYALFEVSTNEWEVGVGTWTESTTTLARTTVLASSNSGSKVSLTAQAEVFISQPAGKAAFFNPDGDLDLNRDPQSALQAATKQYVDTIAAAGLHYHDPVRVEQEGNLSATYDNGTAGVGATLTNNSTQAALTIDGVALSLNDRVLIYEQTNGYENGIYTVTNVGSASTNWVLTRATDADSYAPSDPDSLGQGDAFFVLEGAAGAGELYVMNTEGTITFGTTNITFTQVAATAVYSAGTGLTLTGTEFAAAQDISTSASPSFAGITIGDGHTIGDDVGDNLTLTSSTGENIIYNSAAGTHAFKSNGTSTVTFDSSGNITVTGTVDGRDIATDGSKLDGIETGATADQTKADIDALGINAATLDSLDSTQFLRSDANDTYTGVVTGNRLYLGGSEITASGAKLQVNGFMRTGTIYLHESIPNASNDGALSINSSGVLLWDANTVWHAGNDGSGSGLDADTVDGIQASSFLRSDQSDTMTGDLTVSENLKADGGNLIMGDDAYSTSTSYVGMKTSFMSGTTDYMMISGTSDGNTYVSAKSGSDVHIRGGGNNSVYAITVYPDQWPTVGNSAHSIWHAGNDGSGSGLDADTLDGVEGASYLRSDADDTTTGKLTISGSGTIGGSTISNGYLQITDGSATLAFDGNEIVGSASTYIRSVSGTTLTLGTGTDAQISINSTGIRIGDAGNGYFRPVSGSYGSIEIDGGAHGGYEGYSIGGVAVFMTNSTQYAGLYNDANNQWWIRGTFNGETRIYHAGAVKLTTTSTGVDVTGALTATTKSFVIDHPTKEGMKLRYGSLEGPEDGVYVRGRLTGETVIELPDYWTGLVHEDSITVQLTAMGGKADLWVESIADNKVTVGCDTEVDCFYFVQATRKDVDAWDVEYVADS